MDVDNLIYSLIILLIGLTSIQSYRTMKTNWKDPYLIKPTFLMLGVFSILIALYIFIKAF